MNPQFSDPRWSEAQRQFLAALDAAGANKAEHAVPIDRAAPLSARELQPLVDSGVVREASANGYYIYPRQVVGQVDTQPAAVRYTGRAEFNPRKLVKLAIFLIIMILIPVLILQLLPTR